MGSKKSGRRLRLTREVQDTIVKHLKTGAFKKTAAKAAGIDYDTLNDWMRRGAAGERRFVDFYRAVSVAEAEDEIRMQAVITKAAVTPHHGDWKAAAWALERKYPKTYGRAAQAAVGVMFEPSGDGESGEQQRTRVEFYLPDNGRRPQDVGDDEDDQEA